MGDRVTPTRSADRGDVPSLEVRLLGGFDVRVGEQPVPAAVWRQRRAAAIVKLLALQPGFRLHREELIDTLWPDLDPDSAANNLRGALHHARRGLQEAGAPADLFLTRDGDAVLLGPRDLVQVDVAVFAQAVTRAWQSSEPAVAERAVALYGGDLLPEDTYEEWAVARREPLRASYLTLLARLATLYEDQGDLARAVATRERALAADPLDEATHAALMRLHARMGDRALALGQYARLESLLERELGTTPDAETRDLADAIQEGRISPVPRPPSPPPRPVAGIAPGARLPRAIDQLVGRGRELAELERLLANARLVTLTGAGGTGKTRLALECARLLADRYPDGVAFIDLAPLRGAALVLPTIARGLEVEATADHPLSELLATAIGERRLLLVLDNFEQVAAAGPQIATLLATCPQLTALATSRLRLAVRGEQEYPVAPLPLPEAAPPGQDLTLADLEHTPAVELFARRAQAARPSFALTAENIAAVVAVCRRLDGLPLAIELAAARVRVLPPEQLLRRLARPLDVLGTTAQDVPARQRTLRDTIAWSHDLLAPPEQAMFHRLSVFAGGCSLEGAEAVAAVGETGGIDALETLARLIDQSLLTTRSTISDAEARYVMLETIREFAAERLAASGEGESVKRAFEAFLVHLAEDAERGLRGPEQMAWLDRLEEEHANIRAALGSALARGDGEMALGLAPRLWEFWRIRGYSVEGHDWLERAIQADADAAPTQRAHAEYALGKMAIDLGDYDGAERHFQVSAELWERLGDRGALADAKNSLTIVKLNRGEFAQSRALGEAALAISRELGDERRTATALLNLGMLAREDGELPHAIQYLNESMTMWRRLGDPIFIALATMNLGMTYRVAGDHERARVLLGESSQLYERIGDRYQLAVIAYNQGHLEREAGALDNAKHLYAVALRHFDAVGAPEGVIETIEWIAATLVDAGHPLPALRLLGATAAIRKTLDLFAIAHDARMVAESLETATHAAGATTTEEALQAGSTMSLDQARDEALALANETVSPSAD
jgi:predicted ATPase/DNA-binding SARP family transcriptional activator